MYFRFSTNSVSNFITISNIYYLIYNFWNERILSTEADRWFRNIIKENKKSRNGVNVNNNDIMQSFLTLQEKNSK